MTSPVRVRYAHEADGAGTNIDDASIGPIYRVVPDIKSTFGQPRPLFIWKANVDTIAVQPCNAGFCLPNDDVGQNSAVFVFGGNPRGFCVLRNVLNLYLGIKLGARRLGLKIRKRYKATDHLLDSRLTCRISARTHVRPPFRLAV